MGAYRNARTLFQAMELNADMSRWLTMQIEQIEASFIINASPRTARNWLLTAFSFIWCRVKKLWGFVRNHFNR
ncbi:MAG: hypothetical protein U7123_25010 [Potamolinea sp.]